MSLFSKLIRLRSDERCPLEDFHTEIVANVLANDPELTLDWLRKLGVSNFERADKVTVTTQVKLEPIEGLHDAGSRPDMVILIREEGRSEVVFIESKVGSVEGEGQLSKYMDHLRACPDVDRRSLVFITRDYEPKDDLSDEEVTFAQTRWSDFYRFLNAHESRSDTVRELLQFMKENNMSQSNRFTAIDLLALTNHSHARSLMEQTLVDKITEIFQSETGRWCTEADRHKQLRDSKRYTNWADCGSSQQFQYWLGYWFPDEQPFDSPEVGIEIYVNQKAAELPAIAATMRKFVESSKANGRIWEHWEYTCGDEWEGIGCKKKLEEFFVSKDHVAAIKTWFEDLLGDAASFREMIPNLP